MNTFNDASSNALFEQIIENHNATTIIMDENEVYVDDYHVDDTVDDDNTIEYDEDYDMDYEMEYEIDTEEQQHINLTVESAAVHDEELDEELNEELDDESHDESHEELDEDIRRNGYFQNIVRRYLLGNFLLENQDQPNILNASLNQENKYKDVISSDGLKLLTRTTYTTNVCSNDNCPISQEDFKEGDEITVLPCKHGFKNGTVEKWLETQRPECPICRYKFDSVEIKNKDYQDISLSNNADRNLYSARNEFLNSLSSLENIIHPFGRNIVHPFGRNQVLNTVPHSYIENLYNNGTSNNNNNNSNNNNNIIRSEEADLNEAIMNSLKDASMNNPT
jgi:hypothetical protein